MKKCFKCGEVKDISEFYKHKQMSDGHLNKCKTCAILDSKIRSQQEFLKSHIREQKRLWARSSKGRLTNKKYLQEKGGILKSSLAKVRYQEKNPKKKNATKMVNNAVKYGFLEKPKECAVCGEYNKRIHGHHCDYDKPLDVIWMCPSCHSEWHRNNKSING